ncbi:MAG TPA: Ig-like domain-containing protein [Dokdonella sp.]|uniref:Ig-like domain-containing protein n=1 Tax=Dokdonella sp. TaxID=2291710 RepID=UPI002B97CB1F|nr:Ig-like domain-containing protein [Dokdonella sp.]HUD41704.1 Ig-like domain-containing protein [Dokdonella sp.]
MIECSVSPPAAACAGVSRPSRRRWPVAVLAALLFALASPLFAAAPSGAIATATTLTSSANPAPFGQLVFYRASVTAASGTTVPGGQVTFYDGATPIITIDLEPDGQGTMGAGLSAGSHALTVRYAGDAAHAASVSAVLDQLIERPATTTSVGSDRNPAIAGQAVTFTASVGTTVFNSPTPTGSVTFFDGTTALGTAALDAASRAQLTTSALAAGSHAISARYDGDAANAGSTSAPLAQLVEAATIEVAVTLGTDAPPACAGTTSLDVVAGTPVNYCFTVTNRTAQTLRYHSLSASGFDVPVAVPGDPFESVLFELEIAPGATARYNKVVVAGAANAATFRWTALPALPTYGVDDAAPTDRIELGTGGTPVGAPALLQLPFPFTLYGRSFGGGGQEGLCVYNNGAAQFVTRADACGGAFPLYGGDNWFPPPPDANDSLLPYWDALGEAGSIRHAIVGEAPARRFVVEWRQKNHSLEELLGLGCVAAPQDCGIGFQLILDESGAITFHYDDVAFDTEGGDPLLIDRGGSATIALIDTSRHLRQEYSIEQQRVFGGQTIRWQPAEPSYRAQAAASLGIGMPRIRATPESMAVHAVRDEVLIRSLGIANDGNLDLEWTLDRASAAARLPAAPRHVAPLGDPSRTALGAPPAAAGSAGVWRPNPAPWQPEAVFELPAYGVKNEALQYIELVGLDARHPAGFVRVGVTHQTLAGDFVGTDFSREYVITQCESVAEECLSTIDTATARLTEVAVSRPPAGHHWTGMAWDEDSGTLYATSSTCDNPDPAAGKRTYLNTFDPVSGVHAPVAEIVTGTPLCIVDIAIAPNGQMFGLDIFHDALVAIDKTSGTARPVGSIGFDANYQQSMDFDDASGVLYLAGYADGSPALVGMYTVDPVTGLATLIGRFDYSYAFMNLAALAIARPGGACARPDSVPWLFFDLVGGVTAPGQQSSARVVFDAGGLATGTYAANLCVASNDPRRPLLQVPVTLAVGTDALFANGFDAQ